MMASRVQLLATLPRTSPVRRFTTYFHGSLTAQFTLAVAVHGPDVR